jgi:hypothetical protein
MATEAQTASGSTLRFLGPLVVLLFIGGAWVSWLGTRGQGAAAPAAPDVPSRSASPIVQIELPVAELEAPPGPHRERFQVACTLCHSPRLAFTQPGFTEKKWTEIVHKMVAVYGAPVSASEEREIVAYLTAVHGE